jgi:DNA-directed RNA polymerase specialized sigma24 family protein
MGSSPQDEPVAADQSRAFDQMPAGSLEPAAPGAAFMELYNGLYPLVLAGSRRLGMDPADAEEMAHDIVVKECYRVHQNGSAFDWKNAEGWAWTVSVRGLSKFRSHARKHDALPEDTDPLAQPATTAAPDAALNVADMQRLWDGEIATWSEARRAVYLATRKGLKYDEAAAQLGIAPNTVRRHVAEAYRRLRIVLADYNPPKPQAGPNRTKAEE